MDQSCLSVYKIDSLLYHYLFIIIIIIIEMWPFIRNLSKIFEFEWKFFLGPHVTRGLPGSLTC